ncbi:hypothetical protein [Salinispora cortesiana]|uniref:hypothetical protein n=1 Tax=Salinispora cortesiana TaxID=1305843 RepID=UPI00040CDC00|nr:hypothetical protein [Salinispora cortesiana]
MSTEITTNRGQRRPRPRPSSTPTNHGGAPTRTKGDVDIDRKSAVEQNQRTNHLGSPATPERCFG